MDSQNKIQVPNGSDITLKCEVILELGYFNNTETFSKNEISPNFVWTFENEILINEEAEIRCHLIQFHDIESNSFKDKRYQCFQELLIYNITSSNNGHYNCNSSIWQNGLR